MSKYALTIIATDEDMQLLEQAAVGLTDVTLSEARSLEGSGEGLNFPIDPHTAIESLKLVGAFLSTIVSAKKLFDAWSERRKQAQQEDEETPQQIMIADVRTGQIIYKGSRLDGEVVTRLVNALSEAQLQGSSYGSYRCIADESSSG